MADSYYLEVLPRHGIKGGYFAVEAVPISWLNAKNMQDYSSDFAYDEDYIEHCRDLEFAVNEDVFIPDEPLYFVRERFDPDFFANKLNAELGWNSNFPGEFDPWGANFYSMEAVETIRDECLKRAEGVSGQLAKFYHEVAGYMGPMLELDWKKYVVCFYGS